MEYLAESQAQRYLNHLQNIMNNGVKIYPRGSSPDAVKSTNWTGPEHKLAAILGVI